MTHDEKWQVQYDRYMEFMRINKRRPSKHRVAEHEMVNWFKYTKKQLIKDSFSPERREKFRLLLAVAEQCRHKNQYE